MYRLTTVSLLLVLLFSCKSSKEANNDSNNSAMTIEETAISQMGKPVEIIESPEGTYALCIKQAVDNNERKEIMVLEVKTQIVVYPLNSIFGKIEWEADDLLKILKYPGKIEDKTSKPEDFTEYINIKKPETTKY